ncbi:haloalkane dehalogenase [Desertibaculum subflavum]|uniref:haloalkane dehalogenase n=1 Tax=Desertibaculum subflavum TaxID=2268458 RepID=UPI000E675289
MPEILRTPEDRFTGLPGYAFAPHYAEDMPGYPGLRMHYLDEGKRAGRTFLCLHGQPTWSYLYRRMLPVFTEAGHRVVAPDLYGFGRSDKPADEATYTFTWHRRSLLALIDRLALKDIVLVVQDWGGLLGLTLPMELGSRVTGLLVMNTTLGTGDAPLAPGFLAWRDWSNKNPDMDIAKLMQRGCPHLTPAEAAAYALPFPDARHKAGLRRFPNLVPDHPDADGAALSRQARDYLRSQWSGKTFMAVGMQDPVLGPPVMAALRADIKGCPAPLEVKEGGHFLQEWGEPVARAALEVLA